MRTSCTRSPCSCAASYARICRSPTLPRRWRARCAGSFASGWPPGRAPAVLRGALWRVDLAVAAAPRLQSARLAAPARRSPRRARRGGAADSTLDPPSAHGADRARDGRRRDERADPSRAGARVVITGGALVVTALIGVPALVFVLWPLLGRARRGRTLLALPPDRRQQLEEEKRAALGAIRELEFEHAAGHVSDADFAELRARYEAEAAAVLTELDRLAPAEPAPA